MSILGTLEQTVIEQDCLTSSPRPRLDFFEQKHWILFSESNENVDLFRKTKTKTIFAKKTNTKNIFGKIVRTENEICFPKIPTSNGDIKYISILVHFYFLVVRDPFGVCSGSVGAPFEPISDQNCRSQTYKISKIFNLCGRRRRGGGPLAAVPSPAARRAPAAAATAAQIENFCEKFFKKFLKY